MFDQYKKQLSSVDKLVQDIREAAQITQSKADNEENKDKKEMYLKQLNKVKESLDKYEKEKSAAGESLKQELIDNSSDILMTWLDKSKGHGVTDNSIFSQLPRHYESKFHADMAALNVSFELGFKCQTPCLVTFCLLSVARPGRVDGCLDFAAICTDACERIRAGDHCFHSKNHRQRFRVSSCTCC